MRNQTSVHSADAIRKVVLEAFDKCRQIPGGPFDPSRFLAFLTAEGTFKSLEIGDGHKRFCRFFDCIEDDLKIFIGTKKIRKNWELEEFCAYLERAVKGRKSGLRGAEYFNERMVGCVLALSILTLPLVALSIWRGGYGYWIAAGISIPYVLISWWFLKDYRRYRRILKFKID
jgi:hypothetical protein